MAMAEGFLAAAENPGSDCGVAANSARRRTWDARWWKPCWKGVKLAIRNPPSHPCWSILKHFGCKDLDYSRFIRIDHMIYPNISRQFPHICGDKVHIRDELWFGVCNTKVRKGCWLERSWLKAIYGICFSDQVPIFLVASTVCNLWVSSLEWHQDLLTFILFGWRKTLGNTQQILLLSAAFWNYPPSEAIRSHPWESAGRSMDSAQFFLESSHWGTDGSACVYIYIDN